MSAEVNEPITRETISNYQCEDCGAVATGVVIELKEGVPDHGWQTWEWVGPHFNCDAHRAAEMSTRVTTNVSCEKCGRIATYIMMEEIKEGLPNPVRQDYKSYTEHHYCNVHVPKEWNTRSTHN